MLIPIECEFCGRRQNVTPNMAGQQVVCRNCGGQNQVPGSPPAAGDRGPVIGGPLAGAQPEPGFVRQAASMRGCPFCAEPIGAEANRCPHCGEQLAGGARPSSRLQDTTAVDNAANLALILGIVSWTLCALAAPFAIIKGNEARRMAAQCGIATPVTATIGLVMGWCWVAMFLVGTAFFMLVLVLGAL